MRLIVVSGLSGSGKSVALHVLEDLGYDSIGNIPVTLLKSVVSEIAQDGDESTQLLAVGIDTRSHRESLDSLPEIIEEIKKQNVHTELLFLQCTDDVLLKRYGESRRRHPLDEHGTALRAAIRSERELLSAAVNAADLVIDTTRTSVYELADAIRERVDRRTAQSMSVLIESFGFKNGIPADADFVFDMRCLPNPYWKLELRGLTGLDEEVTNFLDAHPAFIDMYKDILDFLERWIPQYDNAQRGYLTIAIGCTGGQHRSVYMTEKLASALRASHDSILTRHNELATHPLSKS